MSSKWHQKKERLRNEQFERELQGRSDEFDGLKSQTSDVAMGGGEEAFYEKKMTKEEKKAAKKAAREAKRKAKEGGGGGGVQDTDGNTSSSNDVSNKVAAMGIGGAHGGGAHGGGAHGGGAHGGGAHGDVGDGGTIPTTQTMQMEYDDGIDHVQSDALASAGTICTFSASKKGVDARSRDINVTNFTLQHMGAVLLDETEIVLNHGNRYGLIGRNGCGKSTLLQALGARAIPIPRGIDIFFLSEEVEPSDTMTALDAVMSVDQERLRLEALAEELNTILTDIADKISSGEDVPSEPSQSQSQSQDANNNNNNDAENTRDTSTTTNTTAPKSWEEQQEEVMDTLNAVYERLDALDASTAEVRARSILKGLGFTHEMQEKKTKDFSGGWRMRVSLARALFIQPVCLLLDEPTNHLDMEAVIWLEDYLSRWNRILLLVSHSQDFLNNVCTHMIHFTNQSKKLQYYDGNYDQFVKTKTEKEENQWKQYKWEQEQIKSMKEYIARFGHGTAKNAKQAQSKEKVLAKMIRNGLTEKPEEEKPLNFKFPNPGSLPPPVLAFHDVKFAYPNCEPLYSHVDFGVDLDSRIALVGPNGAGKTTLVKLMAGELQPTSGDIRPHGHLKLGRFTQHFIDVLDLDATPLEFFEQLRPNDPREEQRKYLGRFGVSGKMQVQKMKELSDGQKSRVVFAKLGRDVPHILLLDEPTNHLDMESIDALAKAINIFEGGMVLVSHDMRLISQVAKEIWICDNKTITKYKGDILRFKMDMRAQMGIDHSTNSTTTTTTATQPQLKGDASVKSKTPAAATTTTTTTTTKKQNNKKKNNNTLDVIAPPSFSTANKIANGTGTSTPPPSSSSSLSSSQQQQEQQPKKYIPPHLRKKK